MPVATAGPDSARKGPYASALLAQFGAEVIKIEPPKAGDPLRKWRKLHDGTCHVTGFQDRPPVRVGVSLGDTLA